MYRGAFGTWFSFQNTLQRAAPLMLTALCTALPARLGLIVIGGEGALVLGGLARGRRRPWRCAGRRPRVVLLAMVLGGLAGGRALDRARRRAARPPRRQRDASAACCSTTSPSPLFNHLVEGPLRDPASLNKPSTRPIGEANMLGTVPGHGRALGPGLRPGRLPGRLRAHGPDDASGSRPASSAATSARPCSAGLRVPRLVIVGCFLAGGCAGPGRHGRGGRRARHGQRLARSPATATAASWWRSWRATTRWRSSRSSLLLGGIGASGGLLQRTVGPARRHRQRAAGDPLRRHPGQRDAREPLGRRARGRAAAQPWSDPRRSERRTDGRGDGLGLLGRAARGAGRRPARQHAVSVRQPGRVPHREERPGQPGPRGHAGDGRDVRLRRLLPQRLALAGRAGGRRWWARPSARCTRFLCARPRVNDIAVGIALMLLGIGLAFFLGKPLIKPTRPAPARPAAWGTSATCPRCGRPCR